MVERLRLPPPTPSEPKKRVRRPKNPRGRGRPPGSTNVLSLEQRKAAAATGELPHQFMLRVMRLGIGKYIGGEVVKGKQIGGHQITWEDVKWAARAAAPYFAARLASIQLKPDNKPPVVIQIDPSQLRGMSPTEMSQILAALLAANAPPTMINGEAINTDQDIIDTVDAELYGATLN